MQQPGHYFSSATMSQVLLWVKGYYKMLLIGRRQQILN